MSLTPGKIPEMKPAENVWDAIAADLAAVTAATNGPGEKSPEDFGAEAQILKSKSSVCSHDPAIPQVELGVKETQDGTGRSANQEINADNRSDAVQDSSGRPLTAKAQGRVKVRNGSCREPVGSKGEGTETKDEPNSADDVVEILTESDEEDGNNHEEGEKEDKGENFLRKRNRSSDHRGAGGPGKKLKVQLPVSDDTVEISQRMLLDGTTTSGETSTRGQEPRLKADWVEPPGANILLPFGLEKFQRVFTALNTACGYLLKQQLDASWQNVKQAMRQLSGADSEIITIEDVRRLSVLCPRIIMLSRSSGEGEDATFHIELFDPADAIRKDVPSSTNGMGAVTTEGNGSSNPTSDGKQVSDHEAKVIVQRRQKAFQMSLGQMVLQYQAPQSASISLNGDEPVKHPTMLPHHALLRHPSHEGHHNMGPGMLPLPSQPIVLPPPPLLSQQLQHGYMNISGGYSSLPFPLPGPFGSFPQSQTNNYAGYQLSNLGSLPSLPSSLPSTSHPSTVPPLSNIPHSSPPLVVDVPEVPAAPEPSPYHGMSLNKAKRRRSRNWDTWEIILLVQAKKSEWERSDGSSGRDRFETSVERWKKVEKFLKENKVVDRDAAACKNKWEAILSDYKSIKDWNRKAGNTVYSLLSPAEKKAANLPAVFASSLLELMDTFQGKSSHISPPSVVDSLARNNTAVSGGAASGGDASGAEDSGEAHPSALVGDGAHGSAGRRKKWNGASSPLVAAFDRLSANMLNIEKGRDERSERIWALENRKYDLEKSKFELQARKVEAEREDRKGLVRVLGNLAGAFHRMADKM